MDKGKAEDPLNGVAEVMEKHFTSQVCAHDSNDGENCVYGYVNKMSNMIITVILLDIIIKIKTRIQNNDNNKNIKLIANVKVIVMNTIRVTIILILVTVRIMLTLATVKDV